MQPNPDNPLGNPPYPGATSSNGPNYIDFLATTYNRSYIQAYNLGYGGATVDQALVASSYGPVVQSFEQQVTDTFIPVYSNNDNVSWTSNDTLFSIFFGINDVLLSYAARNDSLNYDIIKAYEGLVNRVRISDPNRYMIVVRDHANKFTRSYTQRVLATLSSSTSRQSTVHLGARSKAHLIDLI